MDARIVPGAASGAGPGYLRRVVIDVDKLALPVLRVSETDMAVLKPAGMPTDLTRDPKRLSLLSAVRAAVAPGITPRLVHRLDRVTRGVVIVTFTREAASFYSEQIREGMWDKYYIARIPRPDAARSPLHLGLVGRHKAYIKECDSHSEVVRAGGKPSFLEILAIDDAPRRTGESQALIRLLTGRLHQIRVMLAALGLPLIGDEVYGGRRGPFSLEAVALRYVDFSTRELVWAHRPEDPDREALAPGVERRLKAILAAGAMRAG